MYEIEASAHDEHIEDIFILRAMQLIKSHDTCALKQGSADIQKALHN